MICSSPSSPLSNFIGLVASGTYQLYTYLNYRFTLIYIIYQIFNRINYLPAKIQTCMFKKLSPFNWSVRTMRDNLWWVWKSVFCTCARLGGVRLHWCWSWFQYLLQVIFDICSVFSYGRSQASAIVKLWFLRMFKVIFDICSVFSHGRSQASAIVKLWFLRMFKVIFDICSVFSHGRSQASAIVKLRFMSMLQVIFNIYFVFSCGRRSQASAIVKLRFMSMLQVVSTICSVFNCGRRCQASAIVKLWFMSMLQVVSTICSVSAMVGGARLLLLLNSDFCTCCKWSLLSALFQLWAAERL